MKRTFAALALAMGLALPAWAQTLSEIQTLAEQGNAPAQFALGTLYRDGQGVDQDLTQTLKWWERAAELGHGDAQYALGNIYSGGYGIERDYVLSYMWFDIAAGQAESPLLAPIAQSNRDVLVDRMTAEEIAEAKQKSTEWIARHGK